MKELIFAVSAFDVRVRVVDGGTERLIASVASEVIPLHIIPLCPYLPLQELPQEGRLSLLQLPLALPVYRLLS